MNNSVQRIILFRLRCVWFRGLFSFISGASTNITITETAPIIFPVLDMYNSGISFETAIDAPNMIVDKIKQRSLVSAWYPRKTTSSGGKISDMQGSSPFLRTADLLSEM